VRNQGCNRSIKRGCTGKERKAHLTDVDARGLFALRVLVSQVGDDGDGAQAGVLGQRVGDDLEGLSKGSVAVGLLAADLLGVLGQLQGDFNFGRTTSSDQVPRLGMDTHVTGVRLVTVGGNTSLTATQNGHRLNNDSYLVLTSDLMTQRASWRDLSASSMTIWLEPRTSTVTV
jgi:hypothetical protein